MSGQSSSKAHVTAEAQELKRKLKVLIVDDARVCRMILGAYLRKFNIEYQEVENGKEAIDLYRAGATFDAILMDREMPVMNGVEATRRLREMGVKVKIIGISVLSGDSDVREFMEAGINELFIQPVPHDKLISILKELEN